jgi:MFS family permease
MILGLVGVAVVALALFAYVEPRAPEPILSLSLFRNRNFALTSVIGFLVGFAMFGAISYLPLYQQTVQGASATNSGLLLLPMMAGLLVTSLIAGQLITRTGRYKAYPVIGGVLMTVGMVLLALMGVHTSKLSTSLAMLVLGLGMGFLMQTTMLIAQNSVQQRDIGVASSTSTFFRSIGGSFGVSLFGAIFNHTLTSSLTASVGATAAAKLTASGASNLSGGAGVTLPFPVLSGIADGISTVFFWATFLAVVVPVLAVFIKHVALRSGAAPADAAADGSADGSSSVGSSPVGSASVGSSAVGSSSAGSAPVGSASTDRERAVASA